MRYFKYFLLFSFIVTSQIFSQGIYFGVNFQPFSYSTDEADTPVMGGTMGMIDDGFSFMMNLHFGDIDKPDFPSASSKMTYREVTAGGSVLYGFGFLDRINSRQFSIKPALGASVLFFEERLYNGADDNDPETNEDQRFGVTAGVIGNVSIFGYQAAYNSAAEDIFYGVSVDIWSLAEAFVN